MLLFLKNCFTFDADNKRIAADRNDTVEKYALSQDDVVADYDENDTLIATYNTPGLDSNLTKKIGANIYFYVKDGQRSIRNLLDTSEVAKNTYDYKAFGEVQGTPTENVTNRYRYTAREWESVLDLYFSRARIYDPKLGRFLGRDPLGGGSCGNSYSYACSSPLLLSDPLGLYTVLFKGHHWAWWFGVNDTVMVSATEMLNEVGEEAHVYDHRGWWDAYLNLLKDVKKYKWDNCTYPEINLAGYSCGTSSALKLTHLIENWVKESKVEGLIVRNLVYADFNWGTVQACDCEHDVGGDWDPRIAGVVWHFISSGQMKQGCVKELHYEGENYYNFGCGIKEHTSNLWQAWPYRIVCKSNLEMGWIQLVLGSDPAIFNTCGAQTGAYLFDFKWPYFIEYRFYCPGGDHFWLGNSGYGGVGQQVASAIKPFNIINPGTCR